MRPRAEIRSWRLHHAIGPADKAVGESPLEIREVPRAASCSGVGLDDVQRVDHAHVDIREEHKRVRGVRVQKLTTPAAVKYRQIRERHHHQADVQVGDYQIAGYCRAGKIRQAGAVAGNGAIEISIRNIYCTESVC